MLLSVLLVLNLSVAVSASAKSDVFLKPEDITVEHVEAISQGELSAIFTQLAHKFNQKVKTQTDYKKAEKLIASHASIMSSTSEFISPSYTTTSSTYDTNKAKLRQANYIETILDLDEGITATQITKVVVTHANTAKSAAKSAYPNDSQKEDAFRHYAWNFLSTKDSTIGKIKTRTITINHEWGLVLLTPVLNYYDSQYQTYLSSGETQTSAANKAFADVTLWIPDLKYQLVILCQNSLSTFKALFSAGNIMDLYNNCYGRSGPENYPNKTYAQAFNLDYSSLILSEATVTNYFYSYVWESDWYSS
jgi:hypothetical protein